MTEETRVLFNDACPVCSGEIRHYAKYAEKNELPIRFDDLNSFALHGWGIDPEAAARRLHVRKGAEVYSGVPAFIILWQEMPRYRWLARLMALPGINWLAVKLYDHVLAPLIYRWYLRNVGLPKKS